MKKLTYGLSALLMAATLGSAAVAQYYPPAGGGGGGGTPGGTSGQVQYNNAGAFGGFTVGGDASLNTGTGALTVSTIGGATPWTNASNLSSGTVAAARLPNPSATTLGGIKSFAGNAHQWISSISTLGVPSSTQPAFSDISGTLTNAQLPTSGATAGSYTNANITVNAQGVVTAASNGSGGSLPTGFSGDPQVRTMYFQPSNYGASTFTTVGMAAATVTGATGTAGYADTSGTGHLVQEFSSTVSGTFDGVSTAQLGQWDLVSGNNVSFTTVVHANATASARYWFGIFAANPAGTTTPLNSVGFRCDTPTDGANLVCYEANGSGGVTFGTAVTNFTSSTTDHVLQIVFIGSGGLLYADGVQVGVVTIPPANNSAMFVYCGVVDEGATSNAWVGRTYIEMR